MNSRKNSSTQSPMFKHNNIANSQPTNGFFNDTYREHNKILRDKKFPNPSGILQLPKIDTSSSIIAINNHSSLINIEQSTLYTNRIFDNRRSRPNKLLLPNKKHSQSPIYSQSPNNECDFEHFDNINYVNTPNQENNVLENLRQIKSRMGSVSSVGLSTTKSGLKTLSPSTVIGSRSKIAQKFSTNRLSYVLGATMQFKQSPLRKVLSPPSTASRNFTKVYHELDKVDSLKVGLSQETYYTEKQKELNEEAKFRMTMLEKNDEKLLVSNIRSTIY